MPTVNLGRASREEDLADEKASCENVEDCANITTIDNFHVLGLASDDADFYRNFDPGRKGKMLRKAGVH